MLEYHLKSGHNRFFHQAPSNSLFIFIQSFLVTRAELLTKSLLVTSATAIMTYDFIQHLVHNSELYYKISTFEKIKG
jgi:hypothetical protein